MREYIKGNVSIDGRNIPYPCHTAIDYLALKENMSDEEIEIFSENNYDCFQIITQIMALKQSCYLLRRVSYSCGTLSGSLYELKLRLINELKDKYNFNFDDDFVENFCKE